MREILFKNSAVFTTYEESIAYKKHVSVDAIEKQFFFFKKATTNMSLVMKMLPSIEFFIYVVVFLYQLFITLRTSAIVIKTKAVKEHLLFIPM